MLKIFLTVSYQYVSLVIDLKIKIVSDYQHYTNSKTIIVFELLQFSGPVVRQTQQNCGTMDQSQRSWLCSPSFTVLNYYEPLTARDDLKDCYAFSCILAHEFQCNAPLGITRLYVQDVLLRPAHIDARTCASRSQMQTCVHTVQMFMFVSSAARPGQAALPKTCSAPVTLSTKMFSFIYFFFIKIFFFII